MQICFSSKLSVFFFLLEKIIVYLFLDFFHTVMNKYRLVAYSFKEGRPLYTRTFIFFQEHIWPSSTTVFDFWQWWPLYLISEHFVKLIQPIEVRVRWWWRFPSSGFARHDALSPITDAAQPVCWLSDPLFLHWLLSAYCVIQHLPVDVVWYCIMPI